MRERRGAALLVAVAALACGPDRGRCLASHVVHHHTDGYFNVTLTGDGELTPEWVEPEDWNTVVCDQWEFPNGRAERDDPTPRG